MTTKNPISPSPAGDSSTFLAGAPNAAAGRRSRAPGKIIFTLLGATLLCIASAFCGTVPFTEDFESGTVTNLSEKWTFAVTGAGQIAVAPSGEGGSYCLRMDQSVDCCDRYGTESATLTLNLTGQTNVMLDFKAQESAPYNMLGVAPIEIRAGGSNWVTARSLGWNECYLTWRHVTIPLDAILASNGLQYNDSFQIRFSFGAERYGRQSAWIWDNVRVSSNTDVSGPAVVALISESSFDPPLSSFQLKFNEPISSASLASTVKLASPLGDSVPFDSSTPFVASPDQRTFTFHLAQPQRLAGKYRLTLDQAVSDLAGNWLDQNGDGLSDGYEGLLTVLPSAATFPLYEDFERGSLTNLSDAWSFETTGAGLVSLADTGATGASSLALGQGISCCNGYGTEAAILTLNLAGKTNVVLDYDAQEAALYNMLGSALVEISADGSNWITARSLDWRNYYVAWHHDTISLDPIAAANGLQYTARFQIRFSFSAGRWSRGSKWIFDNILVSSLLPDERTLVIRKTQAGVELQFVPKPGFHHAVQYLDQLNPTASWQTLPGAPHDFGSALDASSGINRFYRLQFTPAQPF